MLSRPHISPSTSKNTSLDCLIIRSELSYGETVGTKDLSQFIFFEEH